jgi:hypothetical protein
MHLNYLLNKSFMKEKILLGMIIVHKIVNDKLLLYKIPFHVRDMLTHISYSANTVRENIITI